VADDYVTFESALKELQLTAEQLKRLVSEGEVRAIRGEQNTMKFRREEIERLKQDTGKTIQYTEPSADTLTDDLLFDESNDLDVSDEGMATAQIKSGDTIPAKDKPAAKPAGRASPPPPAKKPAPVAAKPAAAAAAAPSGSTSSIRRTTGRSASAASRPSATQTEAQATGIGVGMVITTICTAMLMIFVSLVLLDTPKDRASSATQGFGEFAYTQFGK
jgi:hypothetical protein